MENKKILLVSHEMTYTGAPRSLLQIAKILKENECCVSVWTLKEGQFAEEFRKLDIEVRYLEFPKAASERLVQEIKGFQIVIANTIFTASFAIYAQKFTKTILYIREAQNIPQLVESCLLDESDILSVSNIVCVSEYAEEFIRSRFQRDNITVIHNYVDDEFKGNIQQKRVLKKRSKKKKIEFLVVGTIEPRKGQDIAISAFIQLLNKDQQIKGYLHLVGAMPEWAADYQRGLNFDSEKRIIYHGEIHDRRKMLKLYKKMNVILIPSMDEACSLVALEAAMMEKAIILTENTGAKYLVDSSCIIPIKNSEKMSEKMYEYFCHREKIKEDGRENRKRYLERANKEHYKKEFFEYLRKVEQQKYIPLKKDIRLSGQLCGYQEKHGDGKEGENPIMEVKENQYAVSIIVPTYNVENFLEECMDSIIGQSLKNIEIICVDDGSTDQSGVILEKYAQKDSRVKVFHNSNGGYGKAMNFGLSKSTGEFIGIVEPDDYITNDMFEKLYTAAKDNLATCVKSNFKRFYGEKANRFFEEVPFSEKKSYYGRIISPKEEPAILFGAMNIWTGIYNRDFIEKNKIRFNETPGASFQDNGFWFQTMTLAGSIYILDDFFYMNRRDNPNSSVKGTEKAFCVLEEFAFIEKFLNSQLDNKQIFIEYFVKCKLIGYIAAYNRSSTSHKILFILKASEDLYRHFEAGEIRKELYGPQQWKNLNMIISDPIQFFIEDVSESGNGYNERLTEIYEKIAIAKNKLNMLEQIGADSTFQINEMQIKETKVSIVVPAYNAEQYIDECIESILSQTLEDIEVICVDDGSTDGTFDKLLEWRKRDKRIRIVCQANRGSGFARNQAMKVAVGQYIMFMDADDWYPSNSTIELLYSIAKERDMFIVGGEIRAYKNDGMCDVLDYYTFPKEGVISYAEYQLDYGYTRYIYNLQFLRDNEIEFPSYIRFQDPIFFVKALSTAKYFYALQDIVYAYRKSDKRKKYNATQCKDILLALREEKLIAQKGAYILLQEKIEDRILNEYFDNYAFYICSNDLAVVEAFALLLKVFDDEFKLKLLKKMAYFVSTRYVIPLRKNNQKGEDTNILKESLEKVSKELEKANKEWKQARFEVDSIRSSFSYKVGLFITIIPRKIRELLKKMYGH